MLKKARDLTTRYTLRNEHANAVFWAEKATQLSNSDINDVYTYARCLYANQEFKRAIHFLENTPQLNTCSALRYLAAKCLAACKAWEEVVTMLKQENDENIDDTNHEVEADVILDSLGDVTAPSLMLLGRAYEAMGNIGEAITSYKQAIMEDVYCVEAMDCLYNCHTLTASEEARLMGTIPLQEQCGGSGEQEMMLRFLYQSKLRHSKQAVTMATVTPLSGNIDTLSNRAERLFNQMNIKDCQALTRVILKQDPYHFPTILVHIPCCIISNDTKDLYTLGHTLVKHYPTLPISWYAVSAYYYATNRHAQARRYLTKSISIDPHFAHSHLLFGLSFTSEGEHDQAIAAFSHAARYLPGSHVPYLYLGKEYFLTNSLSISTSFFKNALTLTPNDPSLLQEVGVVLLSTGNYDKAEKYFKTSVALLSSIDPHVTLPTWEPVFNNLGHTQRKQMKYSEAIKSHMKALQLCPNEPTTLSAIALVYLLMEEYEKVVEYCNRSLRVKREDLVTIEILQIATKELSSLPFQLDVPETGLDQLVYNTSIIDDMATNVSLSSSESAMQTD